LPDRGAGADLLFQRLQHAQGARILCQQRPTIGERPRALDGSQLVGPMIAVKSGSSAGRVCVLLLLARIDGAATSKTRLDTSPLASRPARNRAAAAGRK